MLYSAKQVDDEAAAMVAKPTVYQKSNDCEYIESQRRMVVKNVILMKQHNHSLKLMMSDRKLPIRVSCPFYLN